MIEFDKFITITCPNPKHGDFMLRAGDHLGENKEQVAYGCPKCEHFMAPFNRCSTCNTPLIGGTPGTVVTCDNCLEQPIRRSNDTTYEET